MLPMWEGLKLVFTPGEVKLDAGKVGQFCKYMQTYFIPEVCNKLQGAIMDGPVGMDDEVKTGDFRGTFPKRVQQWLFKTYGIQFSEQSNVINDLLGKLNKNQITEKLYAEFDKKIEWTAGDFGDGGSCYWGGNAITRYFLSNWNCFRAMKFYKQLEKCTEKEFKLKYKGAGYKWQDGFAYKGFGRVLTAFDFPYENSFLMWNAYPNGELVNQYLAGFLNGISEVDKEVGKSLRNKRVAFVNNGQGNGWFYTNNRDCVLVAPQVVLDKVGSQVDLGYNGTPDKNKLNEYIADCLNCGKRGIWSDRPSVDGKVCEYCMVNNQKACGKSGKAGFAPKSDRADVMSLPSVMKYCTSLETGRGLWLCPEEFEKRDKKKFASILDGWKAPDPALQVDRNIAAMPAMALIGDGYEPDEDDEYEDD